MKKRQAREVSKVKARSKVALGKSKRETGFLSTEQADRIINPMLKVAQRLAYTIPGYSELTVPGWLNRLRTWFLRLERGNKKDHRGPLFDDLTYEQYAAIPVSIAESLKKTEFQKRNGLSPDFAEDLRIVEEHQADKIGPRGVYPPWSEWGDEKVAAVWSDKPPKPELNKSAMIKAIQDLANHKPDKLIDVDSNSVKEGFKSAGSEKEHLDASSLNTDSNSCFPSYVRKWYHRVWDKTVSLNQRLVQQKLVKRSSELWEIFLNAKDYKEVAAYLHFVYTAHQRTNVANGYKPSDKNSYRGIVVSKLRAIMAAPKLDTILGKYFLNRLIEHVRVAFVNPDGTHMFCALTEPERIDKNMQVCLKTNAEQGLVVLSTDFTAFDSTVPPWLLWECAKAVATWMTPKAAKIYMGLCYAEIYYGCCITPTKYFKEGPSSVKSGSIFTNIHDSFANYVGQRYGLHAGHFKSIVSQFVHGDDGILSGVGVNPHSFEKSSSEIGYVANADKAYYKKASLAFCQKIHLLGMPGGIYPISRVFAGMISTEDDLNVENEVFGSNFPFVFCYRTICRWDAAWANPLFEAGIRRTQEADRPLPASDKHDSYPGKLCASISADRLAKRASGMAKAIERWYNDQPWRKVNHTGGFANSPTNRVLRGDLPPPPGKARFKWAYGISYDSVEL